ncbi:MAG: SET domain-containing protein-lysine N-methyltransferase [Alphaproteobacteria bacterium]|nr:SET domain-containing protein-lysine N-methyltransferase [Alphaproteobacteria bacterium]
MKSYLPRSRISPKLVPGPSAIHGQGVIAAEPIAAGEVLMEFGGEIISPADFETEVYRMRSIWQVGDGVYLALREDDPQPSLDENLNHSCDANSWLADEVTLVARRDIEAGEEITLDHATWNHDEDDYVWDQDCCTCGAQGCRKTLTPDDWRLPQVQARYLGHFHPFVQAMIERR